jgi:signal transduction histidine kinase
MKRWLPSTIMGLIMSISLVLAAATLLLGGLAHTFSHEALEKQLDQRLEMETQALLHVFEQDGLNGLRSAIDWRDDGLHHDIGMGYQLFDSSGNPLAGRFDTTLPEPGWQEHLVASDPLTGKPYDSQSLTTRLPDGSMLVVAADRSPVVEMDRSLRQFSIATLGAMFMVGMGSAWLLGMVIRRRIERINVTAQAIIDGDLSRRMSCGGTSSEFDRLSGTLNRMLDRNAELLENLQQVSNDIAHDLRTPLARLLNGLEEALVQEQDVAGYRRTLGVAVQNGRDMLELFTSLLRISEIESLQIRNTFREVDFSELVERVGDAFRPDVEMAGHALHLAVEPAICIQGDRHLLSQLLVNLIENAVKHTPKGTRIAIALERRNAQTRLIVADDGPGVAVEDRPKVLRRFVRSEQSRSTPGHGLGLSLVNAIARSHFATLELEDNTPGLKVVVTFP